MHFVSVTRLRVRHWRYLPGFAYYAIRSFRESQNAKGNLHTEARPDGGFVFWTKTVWDSEEAMRAFRNSGDHRTVMPKLAGWCDEATYVNWSQETSEPPSWEEAYVRLVKEGTVSRVQFPSDRHATRAFSSSWSALRKQSDA